MHAGAYFHINLQTVLYDRVHYDDSERANRIERSVCKCTVIE